MLLWHFQITPLHNKSKLNIELRKADSVARNITEYFPNTVPWRYRYPSYTIRIQE